MPKRKRFADAVVMYFSLVERGNKHSKTRSKQSEVPKAAFPVTEK